MRPAAVWCPLHATHRHAVVLLLGGQIDGRTPWRGAPENHGAARVVYVPAGTPVSERDRPAGIAPYDLVELTGELFTTGPAWDGPAFREAIGDLGDDWAFMNDWSNGDAFVRAL